MKLGVPDNPTSRAGHLFPQNYLLCFHEGIDAVLSLLGGSTVELHKQLPEELVTEGPFFEKDREYVAKLRANNTNVMMHAPFLFDKNDPDQVKAGKGVPFNMDFIWFVVPESFKPIKLPNGVEINARLMDDRTLQRTIELSDLLKIPYVTFHFTKPGTVYSPEELVAVEKRIEYIQNIIQRNGYCTVPCFETGGISPKDHVRIARNQGVKINLDTMHLMLDLQHLMPDSGYGSPLLADQARDQRALKFYLDNKDIIANFHFTQTTKGNDLHKGIFNPGFSGINELVIKELDRELRSGKRSELLAMVESSFDIRNIIYLDSLLEGGLHLANQPDSKSTILFIGLPTTGCTESLKAYSGFWPGVNAVDSDGIKREYMQNPHGCSVPLKDNELFPLAFRRFMYEQVYYSIAASTLSEGGDFALSACFNLRDIRDKFYLLFEEQHVSDVYIVNHTTTDADVRHRLEKRRQSKNCDGTNPTFVLSDFKIYEGMKKESTEFTPAEVVNRPNYHVIMYDTSANQMVLYNRDSRLEHLAFVLKSNAKQKFGADVSVR